MNYTFDNADKPFLKFFEEISAVSRGSFNEKGLSDYLVEFAEKRGLWWYRDDIWNVIIKKPASKGYEDHQPVLIQGHTDMICEKKPGSQHDFLKDPLELYVEDGWLKAKDTTLGADCGDGIAYMLAVLDDITLNHPPIEAFFSVQEEDGMGGSRMVNYGQFSARRIIATDIIWEGHTYESVSGAIGGDFIKEICMTEDNGPAFELKVEHCAGGHSALNIINSPANAIKTAVRILFDIKRIAEIRLASIEGGSFRNNIATEGKATFTFAESDADMIMRQVDATASDIRAEFTWTDPEMSVTLNRLYGNRLSLKKKSSEDALDLLHILPSGPFVLNQEYGGAVFASRNLGTIGIKDGKLIIGYMFRGTIKSQTYDMMNQTLRMAACFDAGYHEIYRYSGYMSSRDTPMVNIWKDVYKEETGKDLTFLTMHGGTDVGTVIDHLGGVGVVDVIAIGPTVTGVHTPDEALDLGSFERTYSYLLKILARL